MSDSKKKSNETANPESPKKPYLKPTMVSEELMTFGAACNGHPGGGRKATTASPDFCSASKIKS